MISEILEKFAPALSKHGVKLSVEETPVAEESTKVEMMAEGALADGTMIYSPAAEWVEGVEVFVMDAEGNPIYQDIDTSFLVATLTAAIKEQQTIINNLKTRIEALEGQ